MSRIGSIFLFFVFIISISEVYASTEKRTAGGQFLADTVTVDSSLINRGNTNLPLAQNPGKLLPPRFRTIHLVLGFGVMTRNMSELDGLGINVADFSVPISFYMHIPIVQEGSEIWLLPGWEVSFGANGGSNTFRAMIFMETLPSLSIGIGGARTTYQYNDDNIIVDLSQSYGQLAVGYQPGPKWPDFMVYVPFAGSQEETYNGSEYTVKPAGIQFNLLFPIH